MISDLYTKSKSSETEANENPDQVFAALESDKAIQSFFYTAIRNHIDLGSLADKKANILLSVNAIIFSILFTRIFVGRNISAAEDYWVPLAIVIGTSIAVIILSVLTTRPKISSGKFTQEDLQKKKVNLAFFGNFHKMEGVEFSKAVGVVLKDKKSINSTLTIDLYYLGIVLHKKYRLLHTAYLIFIIGFFLAIASFAYILVSK